MVENTLDFTRSERARPTLTREEIDLAEFLPAAVRETCELLGEPPGLELDVAEAPTIEADRTAIGRIVRNLVENAVRHSPGGSCVRVSAKAAGDGVRLQVEDSGPGIPPSERSRVWEPFYHAPRQPGATGSGLGLAIVRQLIALHGGSVAISDSPLGGARITVTLPSAPPERGEP